MTGRFLLGLAALVLALVVAGGSAGRAVAQERRATPVSGEKVFIDQGCYGCHTLGKLGTPIGPDLSRAGAKYREADLRRWLRDPSSQKPTAHMPKIELSPAEIEALAAYLANQR